MATPLRDFFILEFAIYNVHNVVRQIGIIRQGLDSMNTKLVDVAKASHRLQIAELRVKTLTEEIARMKRARDAGEAIDTGRYRNIRRQYSYWIRALEDAREKYQQLGREGILFNKIVGSIGAASIVTFAGMTMLVKNFTEQIQSLERDAYELVNTLGYGERESFALARALQAIGLSGDAVSSAFTNMYRSFFSNFNKQLTMLRFGLDPSMIFRLHPHAFARYVIETVRRSGYPLPLQRAIIANVLGKELADIMEVARRYDLTKLMKAFMGVYTPEMIAKARMLVTDFQIVIAQFWSAAQPFLTEFVGFLDRIARSMASVTEAVRHGGLVGALVQLGGYLGVLVLALSGLGGLARALDPLKEIGRIISRLVHALTGIAIMVSASPLTKIGTAVAKVVTWLGGVLGRVGGFLASLLGILQGLPSALLRFLGWAGIAVSVLSLAYTLFKGIRRTATEKKEESNVVKDIESNTRATAYHTQMMMYQLNDIRTDLVRAIRITALGGTMPPLYEIINLQMRQMYGLMHNTSAF